jgi:hypothetical protein
MTGHKVESMKLDDVAATLADLALDHTFNDADATGGSEARQQMRAQIASLLGGIDEERVEVGACCVGR